MTYWQVAGIKEKLDINQAGENQNNNKKDKVIFDFTEENNNIN